MTGALPHRPALRAIGGFAVLLFALTATTASAAAERVAPDDPLAAARARPDSAGPSDPTRLDARDRAAEAAGRRELQSKRRFDRELALARRAAADAFERDRGLVRWRIALVAVALGLVGWGIVGPAVPRARLWRRLAWALVATASIASFYRFSLPDSSDSDMHIKDSYHYYIGGKYSREIGYGRLYDCTLAMAQEQGRWWVERLDTVRDLESMAVRPPSEILERGFRECRPRFSPERWSEFGADLSWFFERLDGPVWRWVLNDHGFNPSPIWTLFATPFTRFSRAEDLPALTRVDTLLVLAALGSIGWAFGFEAMCLAAVVWGTGFLWRYTWIGGAFLRQIWFSTAVIGICCLRRGRASAAGALLVASAGVRLFPAVFIGGYALFALRRFVRTGTWSREDRRFAAGCSIAAVSLVAASLAVSASGLDDYVRFAHNTSALRNVIIKNFAGFEALLWRLDGTTALYWRNEVGTGWIGLELSNALRVGVVAASLLWFGLAIRHAESWEAAALGFALIPLWTAPPGYYFHFVVLAVPLCERRRSIAIWLLTACLAWLINGSVSRDLGERFTVVSIVAVMLSCGVLATMGRPERLDGRVSPRSRCRPT